MPEGPECRIIADMLNSFAANKYIIGAEFVSGKYLNKPPDGWSTFQNMLQSPLKVEQVQIKGKFLFWVLTHAETNTIFWNTLGITGGWSTDDPRNCRFKLTLNTGTDKEEYYLYYNDQSNFGTFKFNQTWDTTLNKLNSLGPDLLNQNVFYEDIKSLFFIKRNKNKTIAEVLMNQRNFAGVGNYIKSEVLYSCGISPFRECWTLDDFETKKIFHSIRKIMKEAYANNEEYKASGRQVYKKNEVDGREVVKVKTKDNRNTYWVPEVQQ